MRVDGSEAKANSPVRAWGWRQQHWPLLMLPARPRCALHLGPAPPEILAPPARGERRPWSVRQLRPKRLGLWHRQPPPGHVGARSRAPNVEYLAPLARVCVCAIPPSRRKPPILARETHHTANGADVVVLGDAVEHDRNWSAWALKEFVAGSFGAAQVRSGQRPTHIPAARRHMLPAGQYSSANMMVMTRSVTDGSDGSGE